MFCNFHIKSWPTLVVANLWVLKHINHARINVLSSFRVQDILWVFPLFLGSACESDWKSGWVWVWDWIWNWVLWTVSNRSRSGWVGGLKLFGCFDTLRKRFSKLNIEGLRVVENEDNCDIYLGKKIGKFFDVARDCRVRMSSSACWIDRQWLRRQSPNQLFSDFCCLLNHFFILTALITSHLI